MKRAIVGLALLVAACAGSQKPSDDTGDKGGGDAFVDGGVVVPWTQLERTSGTDPDVSSLVTGGSAIIKFCVDPTGAVASSVLVKSSGNADADAQIETAVTGWRFEPYVKDGQPVRACTAVTFNFD